jgi:hypothetical protein
VRCRGSSSTHAEMRKDAWSRCARIAYFTMKNNTLIGQDHPLPLLFLLPPHPSSIENCGAWPCRVEGRWGKWGIVFISCSPPRAEGGGRSHAATAFIIFCSSPGVVDKVWLLTCYASIEKKHHKKLAVTYVSKNSRTRLRLTLVETLRKFSR